MTEKERIIEFIKTLNISIRSFEMNCGLSNGIINNMKGSFSKSTLNKIIQKHPELNSTWLLTGEGQMLKSNSITPNKFEMESQTLINELRDRVLSLEKQLDEKQKFCQFLMKQNEDLQQLVTANPEIKKKEAS